MKQTDYDVRLPDYTVENVFTLRAFDDRPYSWGVDYLKVNEVESDGTGKVFFVGDTEDGGINHMAVNDVIERSYCKRFTNEGPEIITGHGHGLHVGDTIHQCAKGGVLAFVKVLINEGFGFNDWVANGIRYVADLELLPEHEGFTKIINLSIGSDTASKLIEDAIKYARSKGVEFFCAAGNDGKDVDYPGAFAEHVITVGAIDKQGNPTGFSGPGAQVDIACPGQSIVAAYGNGYASLTGTSMATPHAAGIGGLIKHLTRDLEGFIKQYATDIHEPGKDDKTGYGVPYATNYFGNPPEPDPDPEPDPLMPSWLIWVIGGVVILGILLYFVF